VALAHLQPRAVALNPKPGLRRFRVPLHGEGWGGRGGSEMYWMRETCGDLVIVLQYRRLGYCRHTDFGKEEEVLHAVVHRWVGKRVEAGSCVSRTVTNESTK
jgi:hypothetical protein